MRLLRPIRESGFSLIEMLIVIVLISILAMAAMASMRSGSDRAYRAAMQSDLRNVAVAQERYIEEQFNDTGVARYANNVNNLGINLSNGVRVRLRGNRNGWAARATHSRVSGARCAVYRGTINAFAPATDEGKLACD